LDSTSNSAASDKGHTGALYSKNSDPAAKVWMELFTTTLDLYGGVLWSGELQGFIIQQMMPSHTGQKAKYWLILKEIIRAAPCFFLRVLAWY
jgi:hypothetical protein